MRTRSVLLVPAMLAAAVAAVVYANRPTQLRLLHPATTLPADGRLHEVATLASDRHLDPAAVAVTGLPAQLTPMPGHQLDLQVRTPVLPGDPALRIRLRDTTTTLQLHLTTDPADSAGDGTPDFLRLHTARDRRAFRAWFAALATAASALPTAQLPPEIDDCAALLRWSYRNALHAHDDPWLRSNPPGLDLTQALAQPSIQQYTYPDTPLGPALFRTRSGPFVPADLADGAFAQFADAETLWRHNTFFLSRDVRAARPGDLLFFRQLEQNSPFHSMILIAREAVQTGPAVVYHTGPIGRGPGEIRRVPLVDLLRHPDPRWRPLPTNSNFLGVYRWTILREDPR